MKPFISVGIAGTMLFLAAAARGQEIGWPMTGQISHEAHLADPNCLRHRTPDGKPRPHMGTDIASGRAAGVTPVYAARGGKVVLVATRVNFAGNYVVIDHGGTLKTRYLHLATILVAKDQTVAAGQQIGLEGNSGTALDGSNPSDPTKDVHLHFELWRGNKPEVNKPGPTDIVYVPGSKYQNVTAQTQIMIGPLAFFQVPQSWRMATTPLEQDGLPMAWRGMNGQYGSNTGWYAGQSAFNASANLQAKTYNWGDEAGLYAGAWAEATLFGRRYTVLEAVAEGNADIYGGTSWVNARLQIAGTWYFNDTKQEKVPALTRDWKWERTIAEVGTTFMVWIITVNLNAKLGATAYAKYGIAATATGSWNLDDAHWQAGVEVGGVAGAYAWILASADAGFGYKGFSASIGVEVQARVLNLGLDAGLSAGTSTGMTARAYATFTALRVLLRAYARVSFWLWSKTWYYTLLDYELGSRRYNLIDKREEADPSVQVAGYLGEELVEEEDWNCIFGCYNYYWYNCSNAWCYYNQCTRCVMFAPTLYYYYIQP